MLQSRKKKALHPPRVELGPIAWKAIILPLDQECLISDCWLMFLDKIYYILVMLS